MILSHVPRLFLPRDDTNTIEDPVQRLERHIVQQAKVCGFYLRYTKRPQDILQSLQEPIDQDLIQEMEEMQQVGAVLRVFGKDR